MSDVTEETKPPQEEQEDELPTDVKEVGNFILYRCKDCKTYTLDPTSHTLTNPTQCVSGYIAKTVPIEQEKTKEEVDAEKKRAHDSTQGQANRLLSKAPKPKTTA